MLKIIQKKLFKASILFFTFLISSLLQFPIFANVSGEIIASPKEVFTAACKALSEKYYFNSKFDFKPYITKYEKNIENINDAYFYIEKVISKLNDPYTRFLTKDEFKDEQDIMNSRFVGIGVKLAFQKPLVLDILPKSPADISGIKENDYILAINNKSTCGLNSNGVANYLKGPRGTILKITLKRGTEILSKTVKRDEINFKSVTSETPENGIAVIKISSFIPFDTSELFKKELENVMSANALVLDLRNNSGGLLKNAVEIADMFLTEGKIVTSVQNNGNINELANSNLLFNGDVVVLVNEHTASASEILAAALKDNNRALIIGRRTFGKGLVQQIIALPDESGMHITTATYLTPNGKNINKIGIVPDKIVKDNNEQLRMAKELLSTQIANKLMKEDARKGNSLLKISLR